MRIIKYMFLSTLILMNSGYIISGEFSFIDDVKYYAPQLIYWTTLVYTSGLLNYAYSINNEIRVKSLLNVLPPEAVLGHFIISPQTPSCLKNLLTRQLLNHKDSLKDIYFFYIEKSQDIAQSILGTIIFGGTYPAMNFSDQEADFILNHEIAHIKFDHPKKHIIKNFFSFLAIEAAFLGANCLLKQIEIRTHNKRIKSLCSNTRFYVTDNCITTSLIKIFLSAATSAYFSKQCEFEADKEAVKVLGSTTGAISFFNKFLSQDAIFQTFKWIDYKNISLILTRIKHSALLRSHPFNSERIQHVMNF